jgi:NodT family efflux transporter outer membrane factor (OMF) lipoprotein
MDGSVFGQRQRSGPASSPGRRTTCRAAGAVVVLVLAVAGCTGPLEYIHNGFKVGPNYCRPPAPVAPNWIDATDKRVRNQADDEALSKWWTVFRDPVLDDLICSTYRQNLTLREAGFRVLEARAQLGIAVGEIFPQMQTMTGSYTWNGRSLAANNTGFVSKRWFGEYALGFNMAWELDFWGRFRRAVESAADTLDASVEDYDDVLVTLLSDVATNYVTIRTLQQRINYAQQNVELQRKTVGIIENREKAGVAAKFDVDQANSILAQTEAGIPELQISLRQTMNLLCILMGIPPEALEAKLGPGPIPTAPPDVAVGIPADLLRRRPDVRRAERQAAAQCAEIGIAESDFYPRISLAGNFGYQAEFIKDLFTPSAFNGSFGPSFTWAILNYGRILNNVRLQDAKFQELVAGYQEAVLNGQLEVENGLVTFLKAQQRAKKQGDSVEFATKAVKLVLDKYELGVVQISQLILLEQTLVQQADTLAIAQGEIPTGLIQVYKALGGGWQIRLTGCQLNAPGAAAGPHPSEELQQQPRGRLGSPRNARGP